MGGERKSTGQSTPPSTRVLSGTRLTLLLTTLVVLLVVGLSMVSVLVVNRTLDALTSQVETDLKWKAAHGGRELAAAAEVGLILGDEQLILEAFDEYPYEAEVAAVLAADMAGRELATRGRLPLDTAQILAGEPGVARRVGDYIVCWVYSTIEQRQVGRVGIVVSTERLHEGAALRRSLLQVGVGAAVLAFLLSLSFISWFIRPLIRLTEQSAAHLLDLNRTLDRRVRDRTLELASSNERLSESVEVLHRTQRQLMDASRENGMAEVATTVLHNVGNVLNSINVSLGVVTDGVRHSSSEGVGRVVRLLKEHEENLGAFLTEHPKGRKVPEYLEKLALAMNDERGRLHDELQSLQKNIDHVKAVIGMQQSNARPGGLVETVHLADLVEDALGIHLVSWLQHGFVIERDFAEMPPVTVDRHKVFQIVTNLLTNAGQAMLEVSPEHRRLRLSLRPVEAGAVLVVEDTGTGIAPEHLPYIFSFGFTTKVDGHGFGLHGSACAAGDLGGHLSCSSDGAGRGATFTLELPWSNTASHASAA